MGDNLPLLPEKGGAVCTDIRPVLREVFRDLDYLPPLSNDPFIRKDDEKINNETGPAIETNKWVRNISSDYKKLYQQEIKLQNEHVKRLARDTLPNIYKLHSPVSSPDQTWKQEAGLLQRRDLKPTLEQNANCEESLWIKNILNRSSGDITVLEKTDLPVTLNVPLQPCDDGTLQSISIGEIIFKPAPSIPIVPLPQALPDHIICIPSKLDFINFKIGQLQTQSLRLVNISKFEIRISVRPPSRRELDIELCSRLVVTSGSVAEMKVHFRPKDVRAFTDQLNIRVSSGKALCIPITCYMEPPVLEILVLNKGSSLSSLTDTMETISDVLDLGTKLLGDIHRAEILFRCSAKHVSFFLLSEDSWIDFVIDFAEDQSGKTKRYGIVVDPFFVSPVRWSAGNDVNGLAVCRATTLGLHTAALKVLSSTAIPRSLHLVADTVVFTPKHITIQAHDKDYDICSEDDPACEYYVNLGIAFPHHSLSVTINIINHSPLYYNYYWSSRIWGVCDYWNESDTLATNFKQSDSDLCYRAKEAKLKSEKDEEIKKPPDNKDLKEVVVDEPFGHMLPNSNMQLVVRVPDVGGQLGIQRAVLILILKDVPKESIATEYQSLIVNTNDVEEEAIPGISPIWSHQKCEVVCAQIEVWWEVVPVRFTLDPPILRLPHSRRVKTITTQIRAIQLYGVSSIKANWEIFGNPPSPVILTPTQPTITKLSFPLLSEKSQQIDIIRLTSEDGEWSASTYIEQYCDTRHPSIKPTFIWLGVVPPGAIVTASLTVHNDTHEDIDWCATSYRWWGERSLADVCKDQRPCNACHSRACTCSMLTPTCGALKHSHRAKLLYKVNAPESDGCVATLVQVRRTDSSSVGTGVEARASLLAYRVLTPHLVLRVLPCHGDKRRECEGCSLDMDPASSARGSAVLRPSAALTLGDRACYRLRITNITPLPTNVAWEPSIEDEDVVEVTFLPNEFQVDGHSEVDIKVVLEAKKVCARRLFIRKANVAHTQKPLYLVIDAAVSGVEVIIEFPIGDKETLSFATIKLTQKEEFKEDDTIKPTTAEEIFTDYDIKRKWQQENICYCKYEMLYIPHEKETESSKDFGETSKVEIIEEPPALTRVCPCTNYQKPDLPEASEPYCLQFKQVPLRTVTTHTVVLRNVSRIEARWRAAVRRWPRLHTRTIAKEQWAGDVREPGVVLQCEPASGELRARNVTVIRFSVYADSWGLYHDQILIHVIHLEPLILDVWIEAIGLPLEFALRPNDFNMSNAQPTLWMSNTDPERVVLIKNTSRADLMIQAYILKDNEHPQDELPFRLYIRLYDVPRRVCPCIPFDSQSTVDSEFEEMETNVELFLASDYGVQDDTFYQTEPLECLINAGGKTSYKVRLLPKNELAPNSLLVLRPLPVENIGDNWYRPAPPLQFVQLHQAQRIPHLQASCSELKVTLCALDLPCDDIIRVRKRFKLQNVGDGQLVLHAVTEAPWNVDVTRQICAAHCIPDQAKNFNRLKLCLPPRSSTEIMVEVSVKTNEVWPAMDHTYVPRSMSSTPLCFFDQEEVILLSIPLILEVDYPIVTLKPESIGFGDISDGNTRKSYFTVTHSSPTATVDLVVSWSGHEQFRLWPLKLSLRPGISEHIYIEYSARWLSAGSADGTVRVRARGPARRWCVATARASARPQRCATRSPPHRDCTDDVHLIPRDLCHVLDK